MRNGDDRLNNGERLEQQPDERLIELCKAGDDAAWSSLVMRYQRLIYTVARRGGLDEDAAADVFQHVFMTLVKHLNRIEQPSQIHAWLVTTARRETLRFIRERQTKRTQSIDDDSDENRGAFDPPDSSPLADDVLLRLELQHRVRTQVAALDEKCREILTLLFYQDQPPPYSEIASRLGISEGSVGPNRARCLQKLQKNL